MATGLIIDFKGRFVWNVGAHVGVASPNQTEDVHLVQLGFCCKANNPKYPTTPEEAAIYGAVVVGAQYTGAINDPLTIAIKYFQKKRGGVQDGRVSPMKSSATYDGNTSWLMVPLNNNIRDVIGAQNWPFIDRHKAASTQLKELVARTMMFDFV